MVACRTEDVVATIDGDGGRSAADGRVDAPDVGASDGGAVGFCEGGGPILVVGDDMGGTVCPGEVAGRTFRFALCTCEGITTSHVIATDSFDGSRGPYTAGGTGGGVGTNAELAASAPLTIGGSLWVAGPGGVMLGAAADLDVGGELHVAGPISGEARLEVDHDAYVGGRLAVGELVVGGTMTVPAGTEISVRGERDVAASAEAPVVVAPPCGCGASDVVDVGAFVGRHRTAHDDATIGLDPGRFADYAGNERLELPCGRFYLSRLAGAGDVTIVVRGRVALFVGGDVHIDGTLIVDIADSAELDLFVEGNLAVTGDLRLGSERSAARARLYVGGRGTIELSGEGFFAGNLYAPGAELVGSGPLEVFGSLFARRLAASAGVTVHYDTSVLRVRDECPPPSDPTCASCLDCSAGACVGGTCAPCTESTQCCAPLVCIAGECRPDFI